MEFCATIFIITGAVTLCFVKVYESFLKDMYEYSIRIRIKGVFNVKSSEWKNTPGYVLQFIKCLRLNYINICLEGRGASTVDAKFIISTALLKSL
jgi:hypothetical protein